MRNLPMTYLPPSPTDRTLMESIRSEPGPVPVSGNADEIDRLRDNPAEVGRGRWLAFLVTMVAIAVLVALAVLI